MTKYNMKRFYGCDAHKTYSVFTWIDEAGSFGEAIRVENESQQLQDYLTTLPAGSAIAVESVGNWYWLVEEMEKAGHLPLLTHPAKAKLLMGQINKTDKLDARGLAKLLRNGTLPWVWIPPAPLRDQRELPRLRTTLVKMRTTLKNRIHSSLAKYGISIKEVSDIFGVTGRKLLKASLHQLPPHNQRAVEVQLLLLDQLEIQIKAAEKRMQEVIKETLAMKLLLSLPGVGVILSTVIALEVGEVERFPSPQHLASYAGTVPRIRASGGKTVYGRVRQDVNRYLKWALVEAANVIVLQQGKRPFSHVTQLYQRLLSKGKGHPKALIAITRHLAEAIYWMLKKQEPYREPSSRSSSLLRR